MKKQQKTIKNNKTKIVEILEKIKHSCCEEETVAAFMKIIRKGCIRQANGLLRVRPDKGKVAKNRIATSAEVTSRRNCIVTSLC